MAGSIAINIYSACRTASMSISKACSHPLWLQQLERRQTDWTHCLLLFQPVTSSTAGTELPAVLPRPFRDLASWSHGMPASYTSALTHSWMGWDSRWLEDVGMRGQRWLYRMWSWHKQKCFAGFWCLFFVFLAEMEAAAGFLLLLTLMSLRVNTVHAGKAISV